jgi:hypothetical protein
MNTIALSFSGGGFRAAAYSLGCLSYLNKIGLLQNVKFISSTSGGSITNLLYSLFIFEGKTFEDYYKFQAEQLEGEALLKKALAIFESNNEWISTPNKSKNFINAFSLAYDKMFNGKTFDSLSNLNNHPHLEQICANATEFTNGLVFRFQSHNPSEKFPNGDYGNHFIKFKKTEVETYGKIKLGDILASSSCFPSGFEPLIFPDDYINANLTKQQLLKSISYRANEFTVEDNYNKVDLMSNEDFKKVIKFGLMDGGITDNQGIDALIKADERRKDKLLEQFDLIISCDVSSHYMDGYTLPKNKWSLLNLFSLNCILLLIILGSFVLPILKVFYKNNWGFGVYFIASLSVLCIAIVIIAATIMLIKKIKSVFKKPKPSAWGSVFKKYKYIFTKMNLGKLKYLLTIRAKSIFIMTEDVYLKQIRRMYYAMMREDKRFIKNTIYDLSKTNFPNDDISSESLYPSKPMKETAEKARTMGTTLWFDEVHTAQNMKNSIIASGQFTTCYNLLRFYQKMDASLKTQAIINLEKLLLIDFKLFCENPFRMI